jgi:hypothetical protein
MICYNATMADLDMPEHIKSNVMEKNLEYISQSEDSYTVKSGSGKVLTVAKAYTKHGSKRRHYNFHEKWMQIAALGLPLGGLPTVILTPFVFWRNVDMLQKENPPIDERIHAKHLIIISIILLLLGIVLFALFIMHLIY